jgi:hypothetical protein
MKLIVMVLFPLLLNGCAGSLIGDKMRVFGFGNASDWAYPEGDYDFGEDHSDPETPQPLIKKKL